MKVSRQFLSDFSELAERYEWRPEEIEEMRACVREDKGMKEYLEKLAKAHREGYKQHSRNNWIRLDVWLFNRNESITK